MQTALTLLQNKAVAAHREDAHGAAAVFDASDPDDLDVARVRLLDEVGIAELVFGERLDICNWLATDALGQELDLVPLDVLHNENIQTLQEGQRGVVDRVTENGLLDEQHVTVGLLNLFAEVEQVLAAFFNDLVHLPVIVDDDSVVHLRVKLYGYTIQDIHKRNTYVWLRRAQLELNDTDLRLLHTCWSASSDNDILVEDDTVNKFSVFNRSSDLLDYPNIPEVDVRRCWGHKTRNC